MKKVLTKGTKYTDIDSLQDAFDKMVDLYDTANQEWFERCVEQNDEWARYRMVITTVSFLMGIVVGVVL